MKVVKQFQIAFVLCAVIEHIELYSRQIYTLENCVAHLLQLFSDSKGLLTFGSQARLG